MRNYPGVFQRARIHAEYGGWLFPFLITELRVDFMELKERI